MKKLIICLCLFAFIYSVDIDAAVRHLISHAQPKSISLCAGYVHNALEAGGFRIPRQASAYMYRTNGVLVAAGFKEMSKPSSNKKGDITVTDRNSAHPHGHMAMWSGSNWISDFVQYSEYVYSSNQPPVYYYRYGGKTDDTTPVSSNCQGKSVTQVAQEVIQGLWGNGDDRRNRLTSAGCDYNAVQSEVNRLLS
jgi:hypothetical protein